MIFTNDVWHIINDNINRFYFAPNNTTYICREVQQVIMVW
jgi:hypothetical protein